MEAPSASGMGVSQFTGNTVVDMGRWQYRIFYEIVMRSRQRPTL
jgi:hypothetical protein